MAIEGDGVADGDGVAVGNGVTDCNGLEVVEIIADGEGVTYDDEDSV